MKEKKILIVSASIGSGHMQAASALQEALVRYGDCHTTVIDFLQVGQFSYPNLNRLQRDFIQLLKSSYYKILKVAPNIYKEMYHITGDSQHRNVVDFINVLNQKAMEKLVFNYQPDLIICTHPFPLGAAAALRERKGYGYLLAGVVTDFTMHPWWVADKVERYFVANEHMARYLLRQGFSAQQICQTGIPVSQKFCPSLKKVQNVTPKVLVMGGGLGFGRLETVLYQLENVPQKMEVTVLAGKNDKLREQLAMLTVTLHNKICIFPYVENVDEFMRQADLLITKPGGLTCSEALASHLPLVLFNPLPGQEEENAAYLHQQNMALWVQKEQELAAIITRVLWQEREGLLRTEAQGKKLNPCQAALAIADNLYNLMAKTADREIAADFAYCRQQGDVSC